MGSVWRLLVGLGDWTDCGARTGCGARAGCMTQSHGSAGYNKHSLYTICLH